VKKPAPPARPRKPYASPHLVRYGDVKHLTQMRFLGPLKDNGKQLKTRTR
jgi:hypothetical protein